MMNSAMRVNVPSASGGFPRSATASPILGSTHFATTIPRSRSCGHFKAPKQQQQHQPLPAILRRSVSAGYDHQFHHHDHFSSRPPPPSQSKPRPMLSFCGSNVDLLEPSVLGITPEPPAWPARDEVIRATIARGVSRVELPVSLRIIKKKMSEDESGGVDGDACAAKKAFASAVFAIREIHGQAIRMRGVALEEDLDAVIAKVQSEMNSSFVWLFKEVFSRTPDLMLDVMVMMADYAAYSTKNLPFVSLSQENDQIALDQTNGNKMAEEIGNLEKMMSLSPIVETSEERKGMDRQDTELWITMVDEAYRMQDGELGIMGLDYGAMQQFVSPVRVEIEDDHHYVEYSRTDLLYQMSLAQEPGNPLLLSNYAKFLYLVARDYDRAEECFDRAVQSDQGDAETLSQYATFLWLIRKDIWRAEGRYQQAMAAEPDNPYHASKYANFLWSTGGDDTCYPIEAPRGRS
ncbi:hypothetical protein Droror1_Dr00002229 [Drosera rotundifolia]